MEVENDLDTWLQDILRRITNEEKEVGERRADLKNNTKKVKGDDCGKKEHEDVGRGQKRLKKSMEQLQKDSDTGEGLTQFKRLEKFNFTTDAAKLNRDKNRYKDVRSFPYDCTRVKLDVKDKNVYTDYINASHVQMAIPGTCGKEYIATQGPLPTTANDFWLMAWQQNASNILMLTSEIEGSKERCHRYWPDDSSQMYGDIKVTCIDLNVISDSLIQRQFVLSHLKEKENKLVVHYQYVSWYEKKGPRNQEDFLKFLRMFRSDSKQSDGKVIVHCGGGIGRTGTFMALDTALSLMEASSPVYPLDIIKKLRQQRQMSVPRPEQFNFLCKSILQVYNDNFKQESEERPFSGMMSSVINRLRQFCCCGGVKKEESKGKKWKRGLDTLRRSVQRRGNKVSAVNSEKPGEKVPVNFCT